MLAKKHLFLPLLYIGQLYSEHIVYLVPSTGTAHMEKHSESQNYFKEMWSCAKTCGMRLEVFKDWHQPAILKDFIHRRLEKAIAIYKKDCADVGHEEDAEYVDQICKAKTILQAAVPDQVNSKTEAGWKPDHRILAAQALAIIVIEQNNRGNQVSLIGLGIGGGQIVAGTTALLASSAEFRGFERPLFEFAKVVDGMAPFFGPWCGFLKWGVEGINYTARAIEILKNNTFFWQAARLPVSFIKSATMSPGSNPEIQKLFTVGSPVGRESFTPNLQFVKRYYNLYSKMDLRCRYLGRKSQGNLYSQSSKFANLSINFVDDLLASPGHAKLLDSTVLARWMLFIDERLQNKSEFKFGVDGKILFFKDKAPFYKVSAKPTADPSKSPEQPQLMEGGPAPDCMDDWTELSKKDFNTVIKKVSVSAARQEASSLDPLDEPQDVITTSANASTEPDPNAFDYGNSHLNSPDPKILNQALECAEKAEADLEHEIRGDHPDKAHCRTTNPDDDDDEDDEDCEIVSSVASNGKRKPTAPLNLERNSVVLYQGNGFAVRTTPMGKVVFDFACTMLKHMFFDR